MPFESLAIRPPFAPMEMRQVADIPTGDRWLYEPKWDGFRCLAFREGSAVELYSKSGQSLTRYFPEIASAIAALALDCVVLDGELVMPSGDTNGFDVLLQRIHPAASRVARLAKDTPARYEVFDLLVDGDGTDLSGLPLSERRSRLERLARKHFRGNASVELSPATSDFALAGRWYAGELARFDGIVAKDASLAYGSGTRDRAVKVKRKRTADCVVGGFRYGKDGRTIASLLLGLFDAGGLLHHVGFVSGMDAKLRARAKALVEPLIEPPGFTGRAPGGPSRWRKSEEPWQPLDAKLVIEVQYDHVTANRFRHACRFLRWRPDKAPAACTLDQIQ